MLPSHSTENKRSGTFRKAPPDHLVILVTGPTSKSDSMSPLDPGPIPQKYSYIYYIDKDNLLASETLVESTKCFIGVKFGPSVEIYWAHGMLMVDHFLLFLKISNFNAFYFGLWGFSAQLLHGLHGHNFLIFIALIWHSRSHRNVSFNSCLCNLIELQ